MAGIMVRNCRLLCPLPPADRMCSGRLPFYYLLKTVFLLYLALPQTAGSAWLYQTQLRPFFAAHENQIDTALAQLKALMEGLMRALAPIYLPLTPQRILGDASVGYWNETRTRSVGMPLAEFAKGAGAAWDAAEPLNRWLEAHVGPSHQAPPEADAF